MFALVAVEASQFIWLFKLMKIVSDKFWQSVRVWLSGWVGGFWVWVG